MLHKQGVRLAAYAAVGPALVGACGTEPTSPNHQQSSPPPAAVAAKTGVTTDAAVAIDDALTRLLPSLDPETADALKGPLVAVRATIGGRDKTALTAAITGVREVLASQTSLADDPDLAAISLALDAATKSGQ